MMDLEKYHPYSLDEPADELSEIPSAADNLATINRAISAGAVSDRDHAAIQIALTKINAGAFAVGPLGELEKSGPHNTLRVFALKYSGIGDALRKSASSKDFRIGQRIRERSSGRLGKVTAVRPGVVYILYDDGADGIAVASVIESAA